MKCMRICPTQAIRVKDGKARIIQERCIDCGECIVACPHGAIIPLTNPFGELTKFRYTIAIPSPALYAQYDREILPDKILDGLRNIGFSDSFDLAQTCGQVSFAIQEYLRGDHGPGPSFPMPVPVVVRLLQVKYPNLLPISSPSIPRGRSPPERSKKPRPASTSFRKRTSAHFT